MSGEERAGNQSRSGTQAREAQEQAENAEPPHSGLRPRAEAPGALRGVGFAETTWSVVRMGPERRRKGLQGGRGGEDQSSLLSESPGTSETLACGWARKCWVELSGLCEGVSSVPCQEKEQQSGAMVCEERDVRGGEVRGTSYGPLLGIPSPTTRRGLPPRGSCAVSHPTPTPPPP